MSSALPSRAVAERALALAVAVDAVESEFRGGPLWSVASGSEPGKVYKVVDDGGAWACSCIGGPDCSHEWAARASADPAVRRQLRALVRGPRRMGRAAAEKLVTRYRVAMVELAQRPANHAELVRAANIEARIVARLTGHADAEAGDE